MISSSVTRKNIKAMSSLPVFRGKVSTLNLNTIRPQRAGVILYTVVEEIVYFGLGTDSRTHDLTDFGGGVNYRYDLHAVNGALREFHEETLNIFRKISPGKLSECPLLYDENNLIIFVHIKCNPDKISQVFRTRHAQTMLSPDVKYAPEVCAITWLPWEELLAAIWNRGILFSRVQQFLQRAGDFTNML